MSILNLTQNRVQDTLSRLPQEVQLQGVQVKKTIQALLLGIHEYSPDGSRSPEWMSNLHVERSGTRSRACRAWRISSSSAIASTRCAFGSIRTRLQRST